MKPKLLIFINRLVIGGQSIDTIPLAYYLQPDFEILILHGEKEKDEQDAFYLLQQYPGLQLKQIKNVKRSINIFNDISAFFAVRKVIKQFKPHIVHTHGSKNGLIGRIAAKTCGIACIFHTFHGHLFHSYYNKFVTRAIIQAERMLGKITHTIIAISSYQQHELANVYKIVPEKKIQLVYLGINLENYLKHAIAGRAAFRKFYLLKETDIAIGIVGRMVPVKNLDLFVRVAKQVLQKNNNVKFFVMGDGELKPHIQQQFTEAGIFWCAKENILHKAKIIFTSWINNIEEQIHGLDIVVLTSANEGTPLSLIEAQVCGKPVVATDVGGVRDTFLNNLSGFLSAEDVQEFAGKLQNLLNDAALRRQMSEAAQQFAIKRFDKHTEVSECKKIYLQCLAIN